MAEERNSNSHNSHNTRDKRDRRNANAKKKKRIRKNRTFDFSNDQQALDWLSRQKNKSMSIRYMIEISISIFGKGHLIEELKNRAIKNLPAILDEGQPNVTNTGILPQSTASLQANPVDKPKVALHTQPKAKHEEAKADLKPDVFDDLFKQKYGTEDSDK